MKHLDHYVFCDVTINDSLANLDYGKPKNM